MCSLTPPPPPASLDFAIETFSQRQHPALTREVQRLRYDVYRHDLGLDTPDMDHEGELDIEDNDPLCDCILVRTRERAVGCLRVQPSGRGPFYAEKEFTFRGATWRANRFVEGARFAVRPAYRSHGVAVHLFAAFRSYCKRQDIRKLVSVSIVHDPARRRGLPLGIMQWLREKGVAFAPERATPAPGYELPLDGAEAEPIDPGTLPPMMHMLATSRTTLCSAPAYCRRFSTWNFLLTTEMRSRRRASPSSGGRPS